MSSTLKYEKGSPYQTEQFHHHTDFKYQRHLENSKSGKAEKTSVDNKRINVALFGAGRAGIIHLKNILANPRVHLKYLVESDLEKGEGLQIENNIPHLIEPSNVDQVFNDECIDGVIIATPTFTHEELVIKSLEAGKAVLCEKPIGVVENGTKHCYDVAKKVGKPLLSALNRRFDPTYREITKQVKEGKVGRVQMIKSVARDSPLPPLSYIEISGGIFHDCAVHDIDLICDILEEYPEKAFASASAFIPEIAKLNDYDTVAITLKFKSGTIAMIDIGRNSAYGYDQRLEVFGSEGMLRADNESPMQSSFSGPHGSTKAPIYYSFPSRYFESYNEELNHFCDLIQEKCECLITSENSLKISKIAETLEKSVKEGKFLTVEY